MNTQQAKDLASRKAAHVRQIIDNLEESAKRTGDQALIGYISQAKACYESITEIHEALEQVREAGQLTLFAADAT